MELTKAAGYDKAYNVNKIEFCTDYIEKSGNKNHLNMLVLKQEIAVAHFELEKTDEGEELFKRYLDEHPTSGWGGLNGQISTVFLLKRKTRMQKRRFKFYNMLLK